jgi:NAD(P)-dependent dehydrogenase (short-subunit alcohol dehydrogenase family)
MLKQGRGAIVNNASVAGVVGTGRGASSYCASKHAVVGLTRAAALENARLGIRVNVVAPAVIETDMGAGFAGDLKITMEEFGRLHPVRPRWSARRGRERVCSGSARTTHRS